MVNDINKLRPDLLTKSLPELARLKAEIELAEVELGRRELIAAKEALAAEANKHIDSVVAGVKFLHENGALPEKVSAAFSRSDGMFVPATVLRNVTAEQLVGGPRRRNPGEPRKRRRRNPKTGELE